MNRTFSLAEVYSKVSCFSAMTVKHVDRCKYVTAAADCKQAMNLIRYYRIMYCAMNVDDRSSEMLVIVIYATIVFFLILWILILEKYFTHIVKIITIKLNFNEYLAGIVLVAFCNAAPEMLTNLMPMRSLSPVYSTNMSSGLSILLLSGGTICYLRSFQINKACAIRDILFLILCSELLIYCIVSDEFASLTEACILVSMFFIYVIINVIDLKLARLYMQKVKEKIAEMKTRDLTISDHEELSDLELKLSALEIDTMMGLHNYRHTYYYDNMIRKSSLRRSTIRRSTLGFGRVSRVIPQERGIDKASTRDILHNPDNPKNMFIFSEFREALWPVDREQWRLKGWCGRGILLILAPLYLLSVIIIPNPDYTADKHGWSKLLNCIQLIISPFICTPFICTLLINALVLKSYDDYSMKFDFTYALYSFAITVPLAIAVFLHSRTDKPPPYHFIFAVIGFSTTLILMMLCVSELGVLFAIIGLSFNLSEDFVAISIRVLATTVGDVIVNTSLAKQGYERMAFAATFAHPILELTVGMGVIFLLNGHVRVKGSANWMVGMHGYITHVFYMIAVFSYLAWGLIYNFFTRRSIGIYSYIIYALYCLYIFLAEFEVIYDITYLSSYIEPK
ncbi:mitochondrial sodium/calcium exchanger protein-like [Drosophila navojoa]|uniref:mitochondrial sodium/calcium exchanger protein-like n=1 Tax=Drosophila navojoa TaxID=7232 RepID=UPI0011BF3649|nr:mitochondrial sodium/calcium exchanger protein-like [Drosophila navojoa]